MGNKSSTATNAKVSSPKAGDGTAELVLDSVKATNRFLKKVGCAAAVSATLLKELPAPFAVTGLLIGAISDQMEKALDAKKEWASFWEELQAFNQEMSGGAGYAKLLQDMVNNEKGKTGDPAAKDLLAELEFETKLLNQTFASLLTEAENFFEDSSAAKKFFNASAHKAAADQARLRLLDYRNKLERKTKRYSEIQVIKTGQLLEKLTHSDFQLVKHLGFKSLWNLGNWTGEVAIADLVAGMQTNAPSCPAELVERFKEYLVREHPNGRIDINSINKLTEDLDPLLNMNDTIAAITPAKISFGRGLQHPAFREVWLFGEEQKKITSPSITFDVFYEVVLAYASTKGQESEVLLPMGKLKRNASNITAFTVSDLAEASVGMDPGLSLLETIEVLNARYQSIADAAAAAAATAPSVPTPQVAQSPQYPSPPVTPPRPYHDAQYAQSPSSPSYADMHTAFVPLPNSPDHGQCSRCCGKIYKFNGQGTPTKPYSPSKWMTNHVCQ